MRCAALGVAAVTVSGAFVALAGRAFVRAILLAVLGLATASLMTALHVKSPSAPMVCGVLFQSKIQADWNMKNSRGRTMLSSHPVSGDHRVIFSASV
jgi:hypothetical protein